MKVLFVDDDEIFTATVSELLEKAGYDVVTARSGYEALELAASENPDLVILDVILPGLLGSEVSERLRTVEGTTNVPILLVSSGVAEMEQPGWCPEAFHANDFLRKPFSAHELLSRIEKLLSNHAVVRD